MATYDLGKFQPTLRGTYSSTDTYGKLDIVYYGGASYICKSDGVKNKIPTNTTYWQPMAAAGVATMTEQQKQEIIAGLISQGVVIDANYNTFTTEEKQKLEGLTIPKNGTLTIKRNNVTVGTFQADQSGNATINIEVPTDFISAPQVVKLSESDVSIDKLEPNTVYVIEGCDSLKVEGYGFSGESGDLWGELSHLPTYIYLNTLSDLSIDTPAGSYIVGESLDLTAEKSYRIIVRAGVWEIAEIQSV